MFTVFSFIHVRGMQSRDSGVQRNQGPGLYYCLQAPVKFRRDVWSGK